VLVPRLRFFRNELALSQDDLAEKAGVGRATVARGERGLAIRPSSVRKLARALGVKPRDLQRPPPAVS
jgi:transcriptional regulator with XRE-family HTH domain